MYPPIMKIIMTSASLLLLLTLSACSINLFESSPEQSEAEQQNSSLENAETSSSMQSGVEIVWETPKEAVDGFVIHYGYSSDKLESEVKVPVADLEKKEDPEHGSVFRYVLGNLDPERDVFVSLASIRQETVSPFSQVFEIKAEN